MKFFLKPKAERLRRSGYSIGDIAKTLKISESTASLWCREIKLSPKETLLHKKRVSDKWSRFLSMVDTQKKARDVIKERITSRGYDSVGFLSKRDLFIAGLALYWAEGFKHSAERRFGFCNSDPAMVKFEIKFLERCFGVEKEQLTFRLSLNANFESRAGQIAKFWADYLGVGIGQFGKPFFQKTTNKKEFSDDSLYRGVMRFHVRKSSRLLLQIRGALKKLSL